MTMHDDSNLELLERDLTALAAPRKGDERLRLALRDDLAVAVRGRSARRRRPIRYPVGAVVVVAAAAAVAVVTLVGTDGSNGPSVASAAIVHRALKAVTPPPNAILHTEVVGVQNGTRVLGEAWQETSPPYASRGLKGEPGRQGEFADDGTTSFEYDPATNTIYKQPTRHAPRSPPGVSGASGARPRAGSGDRHGHDRRSLAL